MSHKKSLLSRAVKAGIFAIGIVSTTQLQALSMIEPTEADLALPVIIDEVFLTADTDGNQQLSVPEFYQLNAAAEILEYEMMFKRMDADGSGDVSSEEFTRFLPIKDDHAIKEQFLNAAADDGLLDVKEFIIMRRDAQQNSDNLLWKFAMMDKDHNGELAPHELYGLPMIKPPVMPPPPEVIEPPILIVDPLPPEVIIEPVDSTKPEDTTNMTSPVEPDPELLEKIAALTKKLAVLENRMARIEKSISRIKEKIEQNNNDRKTSRLERRLKRQTERLNDVTGNYEETMMKLQELQQIPVS